MSNEPSGYAEYPRPAGGPGPALYGRGPGVYFDTIGESFNLVKQDFGQWAAATILYAGVAIALSLPISLITQPMTTPRNPGEFPVVAMLLQFLLNIIVTAVEGCILVGMMAMGVRKSRGEYINVAMVFEPFRKFGAILGTNLLYYLIVYVSIIACILPVFYFAPVLFLAPLVAFMLNLSPGEAIRTTYNACKAHWAGLFGLGFVMGLIQALGGCACLVGLLVTIPMYCVVFGIHYRAFFESGQAPARNWG